MKAKCYISCRSGRQKADIRSFQPRMDNRGGKRRQTIRPQPQRPNAPGQRGTEPESAAIPASSEQKVPIPRLQRPAQRQLSVTTERQRVSHACEPCRRRKAKCDGLRPICSRCRDQELACFYADGKREKLKRQVLRTFLEILRSRRGG